MKLNNTKLVVSVMTLALLGGVSLILPESAKADWKCKVRHGSFNSRGEFKHTYSEACPHVHENQPPTFHGQYAPAPQLENKFVNAGGKCLDVHAPDMRNNGGRVQVWDCNGEAQQQWSLRGSELVNAGGMCLDVHAPDMRNNGGRVQVWQCNGEPQQQWSL